MGSKSNVRLALCGAGILLSVFGWTLLSRQFIFGQNHEQRPILTFLLLFLLAWLCFAGAILHIWRNGGRGPLGLILGIGIAARLILIPSELIQENDVYRYVLDGQVVLNGENPYELSPWEWMQRNAPPSNLATGTGTAETVLSRISYPQIPTVYPPLAQAVFAAASFVEGWSWKSQRLILLLVDLLTLLALTLLVDQLASGRGWIALYAWNPLLLKEVANSAHLDVLVALFLVLVLLAIRAFDCSGRRRWLVLTALALGAAILSKLHPLLFWPAIAVFVWKRTRRWQDAALLSVTVMLCVIAGYLPFLDIGFASLFRGLQIYATDWRMNEGFFSLLSLFLEHPRSWAVGICALLALLVPWLSPARDCPGLARQIQWVILVWFLVMPSPFPWYAVPLFALLVVSDSSIANSGILALSGVGALYYLRFYFEYHDLDNFWWNLARMLEHATIWTALALSWKFPAKLRLKALRDVSN